MYCPGGNATDLIWRVLPSSDVISSWTPLKPQHSNPKPNPNLLAHQLWSLDFLTPSTPVIIPHRLPAFLESLTPLCGIFFKFKQNFIAYSSSKVSDILLEIHQLWQSGFSRVYSNYCCSCPFEAEIIKIGQSSHNIYSNNIVNSQESMTILNPHTKNVWKIIICPSCVYIYIYIYI